MQVITQIDWPGNDADHRTLMNQTACGQLYLQNCSCTVAIYANLDGVGNCWIKAMPLGTSNQDKSRTALVKVYNAVPTMPSTEKKEGKGLMVTGIILMKSMAVTVKVDVYSFGVVLLEIICCRKMFELHVPEDEMILCDWVYDCFKYGKLVKLVEQQECSGVDAAQLEIMVLVGLWCIQEDLSLRPSINKVVQMLEGTIEIRVPPHPASSSRVSAL
ncbi:hypothetical protein SUGI_0716020 [Cryptomeria japonica]|nr:hypothetical protein SUGI_0716020 [Cryptomeria japonica]